MSAPDTHTETDQHEALLTGWGRTSPTRATVVTPQDNERIATLLASASERGLIARGLGRSYGDPAQNAGGTVIDMTRRQGVHNFDIDKAVITVDAGLSLERLSAMILPFGFFLPVTPGTRYVTVGGAIASDIHGKNHHVDGSFGAHVLSFDLLTATGELRTVTPHETPEIFWATAGGMGLTGIILRATLALPSVETSQMLVDTDRTANLDEVMDLQRSGDEHYQYSVAWVDCMARGKSLGRSILMRGRHARLDDLDPADRSDPFRTSQGLAVTAPPWMPPGLVRPSSVKLGNEVWYRKAPKRAHDELQTITKFFYPLDFIGDWNRFYGPAGFLQYQFVVPDERHDVVRTVIETLATESWPTAVPVLKRMGASHGPLSFPIPGWTLAVDMPAGIPGQGRLLDRFDELVVEAGGRLYLAKDSRMRPELIPEMYPRIGDWRNTVNALDPDWIFRSDLERRLRLRSQHEE